MAKAREVQYRSKVSWQSLEARYSTQFSILDSQKLRVSRLESSFETFKAFRDFIETIWEFIESSFETFEWEKQKSFRVINF